MKTIDDLLEHAKNEKPKKLEYPGKDGSSFSLKMSEDFKHYTEEWLRSDKEKTIRKIDSTIPVNEDYKKYILHSGGRSVGKSDSILAMQMAMHAQTKQRRLDLQRAQLEYNAAMHRISITLEKQLTKETEDDI